MTEVLDSWSIHPVGFFIEQGMPSLGVNSILTDAHDKECPILRVLPRVEMGIEDNSSGDTFTGHDS